MRSRMETSVISCLMFDLLFVSEVVNRWVHDLFFYVADGEGNGDHGRVAPILKSRGTSGVDNLETALVSEH